MNTAHQEANVPLGLLVGGGDHYMDYLFDNGEAMRSDYAISGVHPEDTVRIMVDHVRIDTSAGKSLCVDTKQMKIWSQESDVAIYVKELSEVNQIHIDVVHAYSTLVTVNGKPANKEDYRLLVKGVIPGTRLQSVSPVGYPEIYHSCEVTEACRQCHFRPMVLLCSGHRLIGVNEMLELTATAHLEAAERKAAVEAAEKEKYDNEA